MLWHEVFETSPGRWGFNLTDGSKAGGGYKSKSEAEAAARKALGIHPQAAEPMTQADHNAFAGAKWLGL